MDNIISLLDTPKKLSLQTQAESLRGALKEFERNFAAAHDGRKPGKTDIKADTVVAAKYKEYNKVRDVLAGKSGIDTLNAPPPNVATGRRRHERTDSGISLTPRRARHGGTSSSTSRLHPNDLDPYDAPASVSPKVLLSAIGPTPRRDGTVLGIFDMLPPSGSIKSSQTTPSSRKRKLDATQDNLNDEEARDWLLAQTPSQRRSKRADNGDGNVASTTPSSRAATGQRKHSKTPISEGKKFMLNHFFATPSAVRFATMMNEEGGGSAQNRAESKTPLRDALLGLSPSRENQVSAMANSTPPYLKRSFSFKERLLSASRGSSASSSANKLNVSPTATRTGPRRALRNVKFAPKPLSQMIADQRNQNSGTQGDNGDHDDNDDDLEALREMESNGMDVLVNDSQVNGTAAEEEPVRIWKKKGQKRTTRRVIMRPVKMKAPDAPRYVADEDDDDDEDELALDSGHGDKNDGTLRVKETQITANAITGDEFDVDDDLDYLIAEAEAEENAGSQPDDNFLPDLDEVTKPRNSTGRHSKPSSTALPKTNSERSAVVARSTSKKSTSKAASKAKDEGDSEAGTTRKINPNAYSHMNFRSLKIKNKNSKAKGRGRFGRGRR